MNHPKKNTIKALSETLKWEALKTKFKGKKITQEGLAIRIHRAISWIKAAENQQDDIDLKFICLWIGFNSCYADDNSNLFEKPDKSPERKSILQFLHQLVKCDDQGRLHDMLWKRFSSEIRILLENEYLFKPFWERQRGEPIDYKTLFIISNNAANSYLSEGRVTEFLEIVLERLYTLRNQVFHGGATYNGKVNRQQVNDGCRVLYYFLPIVIEIMIDFSNEDWGKIYYPVIEK